jgi:hypothetical protein
MWEDIYLWCSMFLWRSYNNTNSMQCIKCGKPATKNYSPDLDVTGIGMCDDHAEEIYMDIMVCMMEGWDKFEKKYLKPKKE